MKDMYYEAYRGMYLVVGLSDPGLGRGSQGGHSLLPIHRHAIVLPHLEALRRLHKHHRRFVVNT
jgi:hypothetical protein